METNPEEIRVVALPPDAPEVLGMALGRTAFSWEDVRSVVGLVRTWMKADPAADDVVAAHIVSEAEDELEQEVLTALRRSGIERPDGADMNDYIARVVDTLLGYRREAETRMATAIAEAPRTPWMNR